MRDPGIWLPGRLEEQWPRGRSRMGCQGEEKCKPVLGKKADNTPFESGGEDGKRGGVRYRRRDEEIKNSRERNVKRVRLIKQGTPGLMTRSLMVKDLPCMLFEEVQRRA